MRVLLTGANGQLGLCLQDQLPASWSLKAATHAELDITDRSLLVDLIDRYHPDVIINAAAYTAVDKAEQDPVRANLVNHIGPKLLAEIAEKKAIRLIHISTDYVFDGQKQTPYLETDKTDPINVYGQTKRLGEKTILENNPSAVILRTSWVFSEYGNNFVKTMLRLARDRHELSIVADQFGNPTYAGDLAKAIITVITENNFAGGVYHYSGDRTVSWYEFAHEIFDQAAKLDKLLHPIIVHPLTTAQYPTLAKRPKYSALDCNKITSNGIKCSNWFVALQQVIRQLD
ncbi:dTDP-4-dehydrorhamnose reductase [Utexia brackfieldae]|uniref:dTDP-4-dehydrorhamnose reductase n=1 Tax=Utexia brackfieldae TaxID=3074108 RepID=UPI00370D0A0D